VGSGEHDALPLPDPARLLRQYQAQFEACEGLLELAWHERPPTEKIDAEYKFVVASILGRGFSTYRAGLHLCRAGLPSQATMLARSLFEDVIAMLWASKPKNRELVLERVIAKDDHRAIVELRLQQEYARRAGKEPEPIPEDLIARADELDTLFKKSGSRSWFGDLWGAVKEVDEHWAELGGEPGALIDFHNVLNRQANYHLHNTVDALATGSRGTFSYGGERYFSYGQGRDVEEREMMVALWVLSSFFAILAEVAAKTVSEEPAVPLSEFDHVLRAAFRVLSPAALRDTGRNDPCPCGSGKKFKLCHGR
jgi:hypothetical protein